MKLSIVTPLYYSELYINEFYKRSTSAARELVGNDYEIIFVNDGSPDNSLDIAVKLSELDDHVIVVDLSRNFGHHRPMMTGLSYASGERIFLLDSDLEEDPEWVVNFSRQMDEENCDVVYGVQLKRKGGLFERFSGEIFYPLFRFLTGINLPSNPATARLMTKRYVEALLLHQEREIAIRPLFVITGFIQSPQIIRKHSTSPSTYSLPRKIGVFINSITSFSSLPLVFAFYLGLFISISSLGYMGYLFVEYFFITTKAIGYTSLMVSIWFLAGLIIFFIGLQGIYISKIFFEVKKRPYTIVRQVYNKNLNKSKIDK
jgi:putative glycosyltransferase